LLSNATCAATPRLQARLFSISSSPLAHPGEIHATVSLVSWTTHYKRQRLGLCSNMLAAQPPGARLAVWLAKGTLRLPPPATLLIIVCTGSGVAPFRSFVHERAAQRAAGASLAPTLVFFGCRKPTDDFLYEDEWGRFASPEHGNLLAGELDVLGGGGAGGGGGDVVEEEAHKKKSWFVPAFSRDQTSKEYVTHGIRSEARRVWGLICAGAHVFVAGSSGKMPEDVLEAFRDVACGCGGMDPAEAKKFFARMDAMGRYTVEAW
jgi:sulfite reductase alpha subunit-like flavoprotein